MPAYLALHMKCVYLLAIWSIALSVAAAASDITASLMTSSSSSSPLRDVTIVTSSDWVHEGFTKDLSLTCSFSHSQLSQLSLIMSLIVEKTDDVDSSSFTEIATISALSAGGHVDVKNSLGANVTGYFSATSRDTTHITYTWRYPTNEVKGQYKCTVNGMDKLGHPVSAGSKVVVIQEQEMDLVSIISKMREMEIAQDNQQKQLDQQKKELDDLKNLRNTSKTLMTADSVQFRGHEYIISTTVSQNVPVADVMCRTFDGYLVEIDDGDELQVVQDLVKRSGSGNERNIISGTDEGIEGTWRFQYSQKAMSFFQWHSGYHGTGGTGRNCLFLSDSYLRMWDYLCVDQKLARFICEIPM